MNIARILSITPAGKAWTNEHGTLYPFTVAFDDGRAGEVNAKTNPPGYRVGEVCGYDVTGQTPRGVDKFKITRNPDPAKGRFTGRPEEDRSNPDLEAATPTQPARPSDLVHRTVPARQSSQTAPRDPSSLPVGESLKVNLPAGQTVGMAVKLAGDMLLSQRPDFLGHGNWANDLRAVAAQIIAVSRSLETDTPLDDNIPF